MRHYATDQARVCLLSSEVRSCATLLFAQGVDLQTIRDLLGHSSIGVTSAIYVDVLREVQRDAVDRLGHLFGSDETDT
ncbi:MAG: hypothetical protein ACRDRA_19540 [Pseudonocardiaceae bacterium]